MKSFSKILVLLPLLMSIAELAQAQPLPPGSVPIDPFSWVVLGGAAAIGARKYYKSRQSKN